MGDLFDQSTGRRNKPKAAAGRGEIGWKLKLYGLYADSATATVASGFMSRMEKFPV